MAVRRKYTREFKQEAVQLVWSADVPAGQIARDLGIDLNMLSRWCREMGSIGNKAFQGGSSPLCIAVGHASRIRPPGKGKHLARQACGAGIFYFRPGLISGAGLLQYVANYGEQVRMPEGPLVRITQGCQNADRGVAAGIQ